MKNFLAIKTTVLVFGAYSVAIAACSAEGQTLPGGSGNRTGSGSSGSPNSGGTPGTGGTPGGAGVVGSAGSFVGTGGTPGGAGSFGTGGTPGGAGTFGSAGTVGTGGTPVGTGGTGSSTCTSTATATTEMGGFLTSGTWHGYTFTSMSGPGTTISPANFMTLAAGAAPCACGSVAPDAAYAGTAMIGFNLNQASGTTELSTVTPGATGLSYALSALPTGARIQIQGPMGGTDAMQRWCAPATAASGMIPWTSFQFECWEGGAKTMYANQEIAAALVLVPGNGAGGAAVPFDFCITSMQQY